MTFERRQALGATLHFVLAAVAWSPLELDPVPTLVRIVVMLALLAVAFRVSSGMHRIDGTVCTVIWMGFILTVAHFASRSVDRTFWSAFRTSYAWTSIALGTIALIPVVLNTFPRRNKD